MELIGSTRTRAGLQAHAELDAGFYATGIRISDKQFSALKQQQIRQHSMHSGTTLWFQETNYASLITTKLFGSEPLVSPRKAARCNVACGKGSSLKWGPLGRQSFVLRREVSR